jgi:hypothetical protein
MIEDHQEIIRNEILRAACKRRYLLGAGLDKLELCAFHDGRVLESQAEGCNPAVSVALL